MAINDAPRLAEKLPKRLDSDAVVIAYDRISDTLMIHFFGRGRAATSVPVEDTVDGRDLVFARLDRATDEVVGIQVEEFLDVYVKARPEMIKLLSVAELRGITRDDVRLLAEGIQAEQLRAAMTGSLFSDLLSAAD